MCVCVCGEKMPPMQLLTAAVWLMDRLFAEGCWLRDVLTKIWLAKPKAYFITHKTFHLLVLCSTERPSLSAECGWISRLWTTLTVLHLSDTPTLRCSTVLVCLWWQCCCCIIQNPLKSDSWIGSHYHSKIYRVLTITLICCPQSVFMIMAPHCSH